MLGFLLKVDRYIAGAQGSLCDIWHTGGCSVVCWKGGCPVLDGILCCWVSAFYILEIIFSMDWCHVAAKCESTVKSSETFVVTVCCNDLMGQLSSETAGLPIGRTGNWGTWWSNISTCLDITCLPGRLTSQYLNEFTPSFSDLLNSKVYSDN